MVKNGKEERVWVRIIAADYKFWTKLCSRFDPTTGKTESLYPKTIIPVPKDRYGLHVIETLEPDIEKLPDFLCRYFLLSWFWRITRILLESQTRC
ncbi:lecithin-cholesterol acyltransferase-like 4 [Ziziphus jujuba]|uniref:Lecithin-cholesterol acyltransferase-like 4 n=1 Tax=Ziziphus jujuba TaxID=326968 RepID=A0ABM3IX30_ZIZJJ|nr:lecithin-cholesterol acyltransferase-like 4 [Ziziphus jujuba]